jgi:hypothetical protein
MADVNQTSPRLHPDIFTPEEAVAYLRIESVRTLDWLAANFSLNSQVVGSLKRYHVDDLDECASRLFGKPPKPTRIASQRSRSA